MTVGRRVMTATGTKVHLSYDARWRSTQRAGGQWDWWIEGEAECGRAVAAILEVYDSADPETGEARPGDRRPVEGGATASRPGGAAVTAREARLRALIVVVLRRRFRELAKEAEARDDSREAVSSEPRAMSGGRAAS